MPVAEYDGVGRAFRGIVGMGRTEQHDGRDGKGGRDMRHARIHADKEFRLGDDGGGFREFRLAG